jgi:hypothetical protein
MWAGDKVEFSKVENGVMEHGMICTYRSKGIGHCVEFYNLIAAVLS